MYKMRMAFKNKTLVLEKCCFCEHIAIEENCRCVLGLVHTEQCKDADYVKDVSARFTELFLKLPDGYGSESSSDNL